MMKNLHPWLLIIVRTTRTVINNNGWDILCSIPMQAKALSATYTRCDDAAMDVFSWCDKSTRLSVHTVCDKTVFSTLSDLYVCSQVRNMSYASDNCRDSCFACSNAARCDDIYAMRWCNDARFSWCDESTRLSVHTASDKTVSFFHTIRTVCV